MTLIRDQEVASKVLGRYLGKYPAVVVDNRDPQKKYRVKVRCDAIFPTEVTELPVITDWCLPNLPAGHFFVPANGDEVWVEFQQGHLDYPIWSGMFTDPEGPKLKGALTIGALAGGSSNNIPADFVSEFSAYYPYVHTILSPNGKHYIAMVDAPTKNLIRVLSAAGFKIEVDEEVGTLTVEHANGSKALIDATGVTVTAVVGAVTLEDPIGAKVKLDLGKAAIGISGAELFDLVDQLIDQTKTMAEKAANMATQDSTHVHPTAVGPSGPPTNAANYVQLAADFTAAATAITAIKTTLSTVKGSL